MIRGTSTPFDDEGDGLTPIPSPVGEEEIYDLSGRRINGQCLNSQLPRGIYIIGGKKILF